MADHSAPKYLGMTVKQAILIGVLLVVFAGVLLSGQGGTESAGATADPAVTAVTATPDQPAPRRPSATPDSVAPVTHWPKVSLAEMLQHNPFQKPAALQEAPPESAAPAVVETEPAAPETPDPALVALEAERRKKVSATLADLQSQKVKVILRTNQKVSAVIGDRLIHEGDVIDGVKIVSILPNGVIVAPADDN